MSTVSHLGAIRANPTGAETGINHAGSGSIQQAIAEILRGLFPIKTWGKVAEILCLSERVAKHRLAGTREFSADEIARLLRTEHGGEILNSLMTGATPAWWRDMKRQIELSELRRRQEAQRRLLERLEQEAGE